MTDLRSRIAALSPEQRAVLESKVADLIADRGPVRTERIKPRDRSKPTPLGIAQQREWAIERLRAANNIAGAFRVEGAVDLDLLSRVLTEVTERHEVLRSTVEMQRDGVPVQVVHPATPVPIPVADLSHLPPDKQRDEVLRRCEAYLAAGVDMLMITALQSREEIRAVREAFPDALLQLNLSGLSPPLTGAELREFDVAIVDISISKVAQVMMYDFLTELRRDGVDAFNRFTEAHKDHPIGIFGFLELTGFPRLLEIERTFLGAEALAKYDQSTGLYDPRAEAKIPEAERRRAS
jgi:hypothetical protein